jgi:hypothetical protein
MIKIIIFMKSAIISCALLLFCVTLFSQNNEEANTAISPWLGEWEGELIIQSTSKPLQKVPMKIMHFKTDTVGTYGWFLIYGEDETKGTRAYYLKEKNVSKGHYVLDEKNGIFLDTYLAGSKMISTFDVDGSLITSVYDLQENGNMIFEIYFGKTDDATLSGGSEGIPIVKSFEMGGFQRAELKRVIQGDK